MLSPDRIVQPVVGIATTGWTVRDSNPSRDENFRTRPDRPWGPPSLLYNGYRVAFPGVKPPTRGVDHPRPSSAEVKERVELYLYCPSGPPWPVLGRTLPYCYMLSVRSAVRNRSYILIGQAWPARRVSRAALNATCARSMH